MFSAAFQLKLTEVALDESLTFQAAPELALKVPVTPTSSNVFVVAFATVNVLSFKFVAFVPVILSIKTILPLAKPCDVDVICVLLPLVAAAVINLYDLKFV